MDSAPGQKAPSRFGRRFEAHQGIPLLLVLVAAAVRLPAAFCAADLPSFSHHRLDSQIYDELGRRVASGDLALGPEVFHVSPGYTYFVGAMYAVAGPGPWGVRLVQLALGLGAVLLVWGTVRELLGPRWGLLAGMLAALYGPFVFYEEQLLSDTLLVAGQAGLLWMCVRGVARDCRGWAWWAGAGAVLGACADVRAAALLLLPVVLVAARGARAKVAVVVACAALIVPITLRNLAVAGEPVMLTDNGGLNFHIGNGPGANGTFRVPEDVPGAISVATQWPAFREVAEREAGHAMTAGAADAFWYRRTFDAIAADPWTWAGLLVEKAWLTWNAREVPNNEDYSFNRLLNPMLGAPLVQFGWLAPLALVGMLACLASRRREEALVGGFLVATMASMVAFFVVARYRIAMVPAAIVAAVILVERVVASLRERALPRAAVLAAGVALASVVVFTPKLPKPFDDEWFKLGYAYQVQGRLGEAENAYARALAIDSENPSALKNLAILNETTGRPDRAAVLWNRLIDVAGRRSLPEYADTARRHLGAAP